MRLGACGPTCWAICVCGSLALLPQRSEAQPAPITSYDEMVACVRETPERRLPLVFRECADRAPAEIRPKLIACASEANVWNCVAAAFARPTRAPPTAAPVTAAPPETTPPTTAPETAAPATATPSSDGAPTSAPSTSALPTDGLPTAVPSTEPPATAAPPTATATEDASPAAALPTAFPSAPPTIVASPIPVAPIPPASGPAVTTTAVIAGAAAAIGLLAGFVLRRPRPIAPDPAATDDGEPQHNAKPPSLDILAPLDRSIVIAGHAVTFAAKAEPPDLAASIRWVVESQPAIPPKIGPTFTVTFDTTGVEQVVARVDHAGLACDAIVYVFKTPEGGSTLADLLRSEPPPIARDVTAFRRYRSSFGA